MITQIYTEEFVTSESKELLNKLYADESIIFLGQLIDDKPYAMQRISEWHKMGGIISETIEKMKDILQTRAVVGGLKNKLNSSITKFHLINNFDWKEKNETDLTTNGKDLPTPIIPLHVLGDNSTDEDS